MKTAFFYGLSKEGFHRLAYREWGAPSHTEIPVICAHGMTRNSRDFDLLANHLSKIGKHLFCPDIIGRGDSDWLKDPQNYTFEQYAADMTALIARTEAEQIDWVGTSMGGIIGMIMASFPNSPIRRLIINDIGPQIPIQAIRGLAAYTGAPVEFSSIEEAKSYYKAVYASFGNLSDDQWTRITLSSIREDRPNHYVSKVDAGIKHVPKTSAFLWKLLTHPRKALEGIFFDIDLWDLFKAIQCPIYLIRGENSDLLPLDIVKKMQVVHPEMPILTIKNTGHAPTLETDLELQTIKSWLSEN